MSPFRQLLLLVFVFVTWFLLIVAAAAAKALDEKRRGVPDDQRGGVSVFPGIALTSLAFWLIAVLVDCFVRPWGSLVVGGLHVALLGFCVVSLGRNLWRLRCLSRDPNRKV